MVDKGKKVYRRKELHIVVNDEIYHYEFHTTDFKTGILNILRHKTVGIDQTKWQRIGDVKDWKEIRKDMNRDVSTRDVC